MSIEAAGPVLLQLLLIVFVFSLLWAANNWLVKRLLRKQDEAPRVIPEVYTREALAWPNEPNDMWAGEVTAYYPTSSGSDLSALRVSTQLADSWRTGNIHFEPAETSDWTCYFCGSENERPNKFCFACRAPRTRSL